MYKKMVMMALVIAVCNSASAVTCLVNEEGVAGSGQFDKNIVNTAVDLNEQGKIILTRDDFYVSAAHSQYGYSLSIIYYKFGMAKGELLSSTGNKSLPLILIDGKAKLSVSCF